MLVDEYEELQRLRGLWSKNIITSRQIFIPLVVAIFTLSFAQLPDFIEAGLATGYLSVIFIVLTVVQLYWICMTRSNDKDIVNMYPRLIEIEQRQDPIMETQSS